MSGPYPLAPMASQYLGAVDLLVAAYDLDTWQQFTSVLMFDQTDTTAVLAKLPAGKRLAYVSVDNKSANDAYLSLAARGAAFTTDHCILCPANTSTAINAPQGEGGGDRVVTFSVIKGAIGDAVNVLAGWDA